MMAPDTVKAGRRLSPIETQTAVRFGHSQRGRASRKRWLRFRVGRIMHPFRTVYRIDGHTQNPKDGGSFLCIGAGATKRKG